MSPALPCARCPLCPSSCCSAGALALPWHTRHREHGRAQQLPPACGQLARPGRARDSLGLPAQKPFPPSRLATAQPGDPPWPPPSRLVQEGWGQGSAVHPLATAQAFGAGRCLGLWDTHAVLARSLQGLLGPQCQSCPCPGTHLTESVCSCRWGGRARALRGALKHGGEPSQFKPVAAAL